MNRAWFVILLIVLVHLVAGYLYSIFEKTSFIDGQWWATVTGTTTGYGDFYPVTEPGRIMATVYMFCMLILTSFVIGHIASAVIEDKNLFSHKEQEQIKAAQLLTLKALKVLPANLSKLPSLKELEEKYGFKPDEEFSDEAETEK